jgi:hypothetical protein
MSYHLAAVLMAWAAATLGLPNPPLPHIKLVGPAAIEARWRACSGLPWSGQLAFYGCRRSAGAWGVTITPPGPGGADLLWLSRLVHELAHHVLYVSGERSLAAHQVAAFGIQVQFVRAHGISDAAAFIDLLPGDMARYAAMDGELPDVPVAAGGL